MCCAAVCSPRSHDAANTTQVHCKSLHTLCDCTAQLLQINLLFNTCQFSGLHDVLPLKLAVRVSPACVYHGPRIVGYASVVGTIQQSVSRSKSKPMMSQCHESNTSLHKTSCLASIFKAFTAQKGSPKGHHHRCHHVLETLLHLLEMLAKPEILGQAGIGA